MKKLSFVACSAFAALMFVACSDDPVTAAVSSSSSVDPSRVIVTDANVQCEDRRTLDPLLDGNSVESFIREKSDAALPPVAYRYVSTENVGFTIKNVTATCGSTIESLNVVALDGTLKVNVEYGSAYDLNQNCICHSQITFSVKIDPVYSTAEYLVLNDHGSNFNNKMEIVDLDVIRTDDIPNNDF